MAADGSSDDGPPDLPARLLHRPRVLDLLDGILATPVTVVSAPAGSGKTVAIAHWCAARCPHPVRWLAGDQWHEIDRIAQAASSAPWAQVIVVDDVVDSAIGPRLGSLARTIEQRSDVHLVVLTRRSVAADVARERLQGAVDLLTDRALGAAPEEVAALVALVAGAEIGPDLATALTAALDGWMAGAMLLALDWDPRCTIANHRRVLDLGYRSAGALLASHLLDAADADARHLLTATACLAELSGPLCNMVLDRKDGERILHELESAGAPIARSSSDPATYKVPELARQALRDPLVRGSTAEEVVLRRAATWYAEQGLPECAAACLVELQAWDLLAEQLFALLPGGLSRENAAHLLPMLGELPLAALPERWSWIYGIGYLMAATGELAAALPLLATIEMGSSPEEQIALDVLRAQAVMVLDDPLPCLEAAVRALALCQKVGDDATYPLVVRRSLTAQWQWQAEAVALSARAYLEDWDGPPTPSAGRELVDVLELPAPLQALARAHRATHAAAAGNLRRAEQDATTALGLLGPDDLWRTPAAATAEVALGHVLRARGEAEAAIARYARALTHTEQVPQTVAAAAAAGRALALVDLGRPEEAVDALLARQRSTAHVPPPAVAGQLHAAELLARHRLGDDRRVGELLARVPQSYLAGIAGALVRLERGDVVEAGTLVDALRLPATLVEVVLHGLARAAVADLQGQRAEATDRLGGALAAAAPDGLLQPIVQFGVLLLRPLRIVAEQDPVPEVRRHADLVITSIDRGSIVLARLTARERLVLEHLATAVTLPRLAAQLQVSRNTIKSQVTSIYRKLGVANRADAVTVWRSASRD